jgi:glycine hydroxymethyltransferase
VDDDVRATLLAFQRTPAQSTPPESDSSPPMAPTTTESAPVARLDDLSTGLLELVGASDPEMASLLAAEAERQASTLELIASENHVSTTVMHAAGSWLTNKYADGYPGKRYYGGCEFHDGIEDLARDRAKRLFNCGFANVQPHCGANANIAAFMALLSPGDTVLSLPIKSGGHLSHGLKVNFSGTFFKIVDYDLDPETELLDYDRIEALAREHRPKLIICGFSAYPRVIDFARFREIADGVGAHLLADIAHIAGLCATGVHPSPFPHAHVVTTTTHKTLRGPRGGLILTDDEELAKKLDRKVFPGSQGGPLMHVIGAKAIAFGEALKPEFTSYCRQVTANAHALATALAERGYRLCSGGTENHLMLVDLRPRDAELTGADAERWLEQAGIVVNKNGIPNDPRPPMVTSGLRLGTPALTTRGLGEAEMATVAAWLDRVLLAKGDAATAEAVRGEIREFCRGFPLPH